MEQAQGNGGQVVAAPGKPHISPSQLDTFTKCGEQYRRRYVNKEIIPPRIALIRGSSVHMGAEVNFKQKKETRQDLPKKEIQEIAATAFEARIQKEQFSISEEEANVGATKLIGDAKDSAVMLAGLYRDKVAPKHQPVMVEERQRVILPNQSHDLVIKLDVVNDRDEIVDFKTGRKQSQEDLDKNITMKLYGLGFHAKTGRPSTKLVFENLVDKKEPELNVLESRATKADYQVALNRVDTMLKALKAGVFVPAPPGAWWCSTKWCGYAMTCPYFLSGQSGVKS